MQQIDKLFRPLLGIRLEFRQQLLLQADHILNGGARRTVQRTPGTAVKGFIQMDMHVAHGGQHQLSTRIVVRQRRIRMLLILAQRNNFPVLDFNGLQRGTGMYHHRVFVIKPRFQQDVIQVIVLIVNRHCALRPAGVPDRISSIRDRGDCAKQRGSSDHFSALA